MPNPWEALKARGDLALVRHQVAETGRYYDSSRTIVVRASLLLVQERRILWHELTHADRRDRAGHTDAAVERVVERHAAENAMPWVSLAWAWEESTDLTEMADLLKLPEEWVHFRLINLHPGRKAMLKIRV